MNHRGAETAEQVPKEKIQNLCALCVSAVHVLPGR